MIYELWKCIFQYVPFDLQLLLEDAIDRNDLVSAEYYKNLGSKNFNVHRLFGFEKCTEWILKNCGKPSSHFIEMKLLRNSGNFDLLKLFYKYNCLNRCDFIQHIRRFSSDELKWILDEFQIVPEELCFDFLFKKIFQLQYKRHEDAKILIDYGFKLSKDADLNSLFEHVLLKDEPFLIYLISKNIITLSQYNNYILEKDRIFDETSWVNTPIDQLHTKAFRNIVKCLQEKIYF